MTTSISQATIPGPFHIEATDCQGTAFIADASGETVARLLDKPLAEFFVAAPDMAEALQLILKRAEISGDRWYADEARAALAKGGL